MPTVRGAGAANAVTSKHLLNPADVKIAAKLKPAINQVLTTVRFGKALSDAQAPHRGRESGWDAPNGNKLFEVVLSAPPPPGSADFPTQFALVDPKTNQFFEVTAGGITGRAFAHGPLALPANLKFKTKTFNAADLVKLEAAANKADEKPPTAKLPTKATLLNALGTYEFHQLMRYGNTAPPAKSVAGEVAIKKDNFPTATRTPRW